MQPSPLIKNIALGQISSFAVLSDIHLREPHEPNSLLLQQVMPSLARVELVVFLGDIFDFIFATSPFFQKRWQKFLHLCEHLQAQGTHIAFVEGNHDFGFEHNAPQNLKRAFKWHGDCSLTLTHPVLGTIMLRHGDDIVCPDNYLPFRQTVKSQPFQQAANLVPGVAMHHIFSQWAKISRRQGSYRKLSPQFFSSCVSQRMVHFAQKPDVLILGHVHENIDAQITNTRCLAGPSWLQSPNILFCNPKGLIVREFITGKDVPLFSVPHTE
jgi:UDP-2,3-diacylglucosamine pyrophosphatase LpxH